jgi:hypothetical protein
VATMTTDEIEALRALWSDERNRPGGTNARDTILRLLDEVEELKVRDIVARNPGINEDDVRHYRATGELPERKA